MSIREDVELYTKLSGEDGSQETIATIGAYLRGYRQGKADAEPHWIPVTERLPEGIGRVIAQMDGGAIHDVFYKGKNPYGHVVWVRLDDCIYWDNEVVAWMPLPEPMRMEKQ